MTGKNVTFGDLTVYEHPLEMGDNPAVSSGAPLMIGWKAQSTSTRNLDLYEYMHPQRRHGRKQLAIPVQDRAQILLKRGYSLTDIASAAMTVEEIKRQRAETLRTSLKVSPLERAGALLEKTGKLPMGIFNGAKQMFKPTRNTLQARSA